MKKVITLIKKLKISLMFMLIFFLSGNVQGQKLSDVIKEMITFNLTPCNSPGGTCLQVVESGFSIVEESLLTYGDNSITLVVSSKSYTLGGVITKVNFLTSGTSTKRYSKYNLTSGIKNSDPSFLFSVATNSSLVTQNLLPELTITYRSNSMTNNISLNNSASVTKNGSVYIITQTIGGKTVIVRLFPHLTS